MSTTKGLIPEGSDLELAVERQITARTWGRIRQLSVQAAPARLLVKGRTHSYYAKQLAILAILELLGEQGTVACQVDIEVAGGQGCGV